MNPSEEPRRGQIIRRWSLFILVTILLAIILAAMARSYFHADRLSFRTLRKDKLGTIYWSFTSFDGHLEFRYKYGWNQIG